MKNILHLKLCRHTFAEIASGTKRTEHREYKPHWTTRLEGRDYDLVEFRNGYAADAPEALVEFLGVRQVQKSGKPYYEIQLGKILKIANWAQPPPKSPTRKSRSS